MGGQLKIPRRSRAPGGSSLVETREAENGKARRDTGTPPARSTNENLRGTFVFHTGHVDTFLPLGRNGTRCTTGQASATRQSPSPRFRNERFNQLTRDIPAQYSPVLFGNLCVSFSLALRRILTICKGKWLTAPNNYVTTCDSNLTNIENSICDYQLYICRFILLYTATITEMKISLPLYPPRVPCDASRASEILLASYDRLVVTYQLYTKLALLSRTWASPMKDYAEAISRLEVRPGI